MVGQSCGQETGKRCRWSRRTKCFVFGVIVARAWTAAVMATVMMVMVVAMVAMLVMVVIMVTAATELAVCAVHLRAACHHCWMTLSSMMSASAACGCASQRS